MSSMRNVVQRRNHRERAQPLEREKLGILEKRKDYSLRARDYNEKKKRLQVLRQKAADRNLDEFRFGMINSKSDEKGRKVADRGNKSLSQETVKLLKTQDAGYLRIMAEKTRRARERAEQSYIIPKNTSKESKSPNERIVFVENRETQISLASQIQDQLKNSNSQAEHAKHAFEFGQKKYLKKRKRNQEAQQSRLRQLKLREKELLVATQQLDLQRARMAKSVGGITKAGVRWKIRERKR